MARKTDKTQPLLSSDEAPKAVPTLVEYKVGGIAWRCNRFDLLAAEFALTVEQLETFQSVVGAKERGWLIVRRLFGLQPLIPSKEADFDELRLWSRDELCDTLGLTRAQFRSELDAVRGAWLGVANSLPQTQTVPQRVYRSEFQFDGDELLRAHGFLIRFTSLDERAWFAGRVADYEKLLKERFAAGLARNALMSELRIHQLDELLNEPEKCKTGSTDWKSNLKLRQELDANYQDQIAQLKELCPWAGALAGKHTLTGCLSDITLAFLEYMARNDTRLIDGIFTATEIQIECRRSLQAPEPRYRAGLLVYLNAAKAGLFDPNWKPPFETPRLKCIDNAWAAALIATSQQLGEKVPDLEQDGSSGEYEDPVLPQGNRQQINPNEEDKPAT